jgi:hypothetical protein
MKRPSIEKIKEKYRASLMGKSGVVGVGIEQPAEGEAFIKVYVEEKLPEILKKIPATLEGYRVEVEGTGKIKPL